MERFLTELLIRAGVLPSQAAQLARAYLVNHGVPVTAITAENLLEVLGFALAGGDTVVQTTGTTTLTGAGSAALFPVELAPPTAQEQEQLAQAVSQSSGGTVSAQAVQSSGLGAAEAVAFGQYQSLGGATSIDAQTYSSLESGGFLDTGPGAGFDWSS